MILAPSRSPADLRAALLARRFYAVGQNENGLRLTLTLGGEAMGSRIERTVGAPLRVWATVSDPALTLELVTSGGES